LPKLESLQIKNGQKSELPDAGLLVSVAETAIIGSADLRRNARSLSIRA
jgi:hypothetical protein